MGTWSGANANYNLGTNWSDNAAPIAAGQTATFAGSGGPTITITDTVAPDAWTFAANAQPYTISGGTVTFGGAGIINSAGAGRISVANIVAGTGGVAQSGNSTLVLSGVNSYTGSTTISGGTLALAGAGSIAQSSVVVDADLFDISQTTAGASIRDLSGAGIVKLGGQTLTITNAASTFSGTISDLGPSNAAASGLVLSGGTLTLTGAHNYTGATTIAGGTLALSGSSLIAASSGVSVAGGATLDLSNQTVGTAIKTLAGAGTLMLGNSALILSAAAGGIFSGTITSTTNANLTLSSGTEVLTGSNFGFAGAITLSAGTLELGAVASGGTGHITFGAGAQTLQVDATGSYTNALVAFDREDTLDFRNLSPSGASVSFDAARADLTVSSGGQSDTLHFNAGYALLAGYQFTAAADGFGGTKVTLTASPSSNEGGVTGSSWPGLFGTTEHSVTSKAAGVYALYEGLLGRAPDALGLESSTTALQSGASLTDVAGAILNSPERGGAVNDPTAYVQGLYTNLLHRPADASGLTFFTNELARGVSQATVAVQIATSNEAQADITPFFQNGVFVPDSVDASVARLYYGVLERAPDAGGLATFEVQVKQAAAIGIQPKAAGGIGDAAGALLNVANAMLGSPEYTSTHAGQTDASFVDSLYVNALGRHADTGGASYFADQLARGTSRAAVALQVAESAEAQVHLVGQIENGFHLIG